MAEITTVTSAETFAATTCAASQTHYKLWASIITGNI